MTVYEENPHMEQEKELNLKKATSSRLLMLSTVEYRDFKQILWYHDYLRYQNW